MEINVEFQFNLFNEDSDDNTRTIKCCEGSTRWHLREGYEQVLGAKVGMGKMF